MRDADSESGLPRGPQANLTRYGLGGCVRVRASEVPVLDIDGAEPRISDEIALALAEDAVGTIVLGCAGMADLPDRLSRRHGVPVIDGVAAACGLARALATLRASTWSGP